MRNPLTMLAVALAVVESGAAVTVAVGPERELKSMTAARDWVRAERKAKRIAADEKVEVVFDDGVYAQNDVRFSGKSGDDFVTYRAKNPHKAKLVTGTFLSGEAFKPHSNGVFVAELAPYLKRELPPIPDVLKGVPKPYLYVNGEEMTLARWPNLSDDPEKGWTGFRKVIDHGWADTNSPNAALRVPHAGSFVYEKSDRPNRWDVKKGVWLFGYWTHDWLDVTVRLASWNPETKVMTHADKVQNGVGGGTLGRSERRFYALNVLSELDVPGEYYIDREAKLLYLYPTGELKGAEILLATDDGPTVKAEGAKGLVFDGFTVMGSAGSAFGIGSCEDCVVSDCRFTCIGGLVLSLSGKRNLARNCEIFNVGQGGISIGGGDERTLTPGSNVVENCHIRNYAQHVRTYRPAIQLWGVGNVVRHNEMHDAPHNAMLFGGNDNVIEYNEIYRCVLETADSGALYTGRKWQTQGNVIRYNYIHDCGPKNGHIMGTVGVYFDDCDCGDAVYGNVFAHMGRAVFIGGGRDHPVENNVFYDCYNSIQMDNRGMEWKQWNTSRPSWNFEEQCEKLNYRNPPWSVKYPRLANIMNDHPREPLHNPMRLNVFIYPKQNEIGCYPHVTNACPRLAPIERNLGLRRKGYKARNDQWRLDFGASVVLEDTPEAPYDLGFADLAKDDFTLREDAPLFRLIPGFQRVPFEKMGRLGKDGKAVRHSSSELLNGEGDVERANDRSFLPNATDAAPRGAEHRNVKPLKVLMIGNSFSVCVLRHLPGIAKAMGKPVDVCSLYIGGCPLEKHAKNIEAAATNATCRPYSLSWRYASDPNPLERDFAKRRNVSVQEALCADAWDIVTIQQASHESYRADSFHPWADKVIATVRELAPQARIVIQQTWSYSKLDSRVYDRKTHGPGSNGRMDQNGMYERLTTNYVALARQYGFDIIPMGRAVQIFRERRPVTFAPEKYDGVKYTYPDCPKTDDVVGKYLWHKDKKDESAWRFGWDSIHLNGLGTYLQGCVWAAKLLNVDVTDCAYAPEEVDTSDVLALARKCAMEAVRGSFNGGL